MLQRPGASKALCCISSPSLCVHPSLSFSQNRRTKLQLTSRETESLPCGKPGAIKSDMLGEMCNFPCKFSDSLGSSDDLAHRIAVNVMITSGASPDHFFIQCLAESGFTRHGLVPENGCPLHHWEQKWQTFCAFKKVFSRQKSSRCSFLALLTC